MKEADLLFGKCAVALGLLTREQARSAVAWLEANHDPRSLAALCLAHDVLDISQVERIQQEVVTSSSRMLTVDPRTHAVGLDPFGRVSAVAGPEEGAFTTFDSFPPLPSVSASLEVLGGPMTGTRFALDTCGAYIVGRLRESKVSLHLDPSVSRRHCMLKVARMRTQIEDLSTHGTRVNGARIQGIQALESGDQIMLGQSVLRFQQSGGWEFAELDSGSAALSPGLAPTTQDFPTLPGLRLESKLGEGASGLVFAARRLSSGERVAVKVLKAEDLPDDASVRRFLSEATFGAQVNHPNAVKVYESGFQDGQYYFVMERVDGPNVRQELIQRGRPFRHDRAVALIRRILGAVHEAHRRGLVHRDIKPSNLLLQRVGASYVPKLADFGLMRSFEVHGLTLTGTGCGMGTPAFMPPEQVEDARAAGPASDIYSLAATLFYAVSGKPPVDLSRKGLHPLLAIAESPRIPLRNLCPSAPASLAAVLARALSLNPGERHASAEELDRELGRG